MRPIVVGTAGHVDHGKTALVKALTGIDTDRLEEEKRRGITIEPGVAVHRLPSGRELAIVDVPGHERLVKNMVRGVSGIDVAMLVVAADDGPMPQTREHLEILSLLEVVAGLVVLTKTDLVDDEVLGLAIEETKQLLQGTFLAHAPLLLASAKTGAGLGEIDDALESIAERVVPKSSSTVFRLPIDRVLSVPGKGTVVTGTVASGRVEEDVRVHVYPTPHTARVREIQTHGRRAAFAVAGQRVGINVPEFSVAQLARGMVLADAGSLVPTRRFNARFHLLPSNKKPLPDRVRVRIYIGTTEVSGKMLFLDRPRLGAGDACFVQLRLEEEAACLPLDRYLARSLNPRRTIGGGIILEVNPRKYRGFDPGVLAQLAVLEQAESDEKAERCLKLAGWSGLARRELANRLGLGEAEASRVAGVLLARKRVVEEGGRLLHTETFAEIRESLVRSLEEFHRASLRNAELASETLRGRLPGPPERGLFKRALDELVAEGRVRVSKECVRLNGFRHALSGDQAEIAACAEKMCEEARLVPVGTQAVSGRLPRHRMPEVELVLDHLGRTGRLVRLNNGRFVHPETLQEVMERIRRLLAGGRSLGLAEARELLGGSRRATIPLLEYLDEIGFTKRIGEERVLAESGRSAADSGIQLPSARAPVPSRPRRPGGGTGRGR